MACLFQIRLTSGSEELGDTPVPTISRHSPSTFGYQKPCLRAKGGEKCETSAFVFHCVHRAANYMNERGQD